MSLAEREIPGEWVAMIVMVPFIAFGIMVLWALSGSLAASFGFTQLVVFLLLVLVIAEIIE